MANANKDFRAILDELPRQEWKVSRTSNGHFRAAPPNGRMPIVHFSLSNEPRAIKNTIAELRRSGFEWPPRSRNDAEPEVVLARRPLTSLGSGVQPPVVAVEAEEDDLDEAEPDSVDDRPTLEPVDPQPAPSEASLDELWTALKNAKMNVTLADEYLAECARDMEAAIERHRAAQAESRETVKTLVEAKRVFDDAFSRKEG